MKFLLKQWNNKLVEEYANYVAECYANNGGPVAPAKWLESKSFDPSSIECGDTFATKNAIYFHIQGEGYAVFNIEARRWTTTMAWGAVSHNFRNEAIVLFEFKEEIEDYISDLYL